jgi:hypothetical protein
VVLLNPSFSLSSPELVATGKQGMLYVLYQALSGTPTIDGSTDTSYACDLMDASVVQCFQAIALASSTGSRPDWGNRGTPAFFGATNENFLYIAGIGDSLKAYQLVSPGTFTTSPTWSSSQTFGYSASPTVTWNGSSTTDAIVWALDNHSFGYTNPDGTGHAAGPAQLFAYNTTSSTQGVSPISQTSATSLTMPGAIKFAVPTVVEAKY